MSLNVIEKFDDSTAEAIVKPIGEIDIYTSEQFKAKLIDIILEKKSNVLIDCEELEFIDSTGLGVLISALKEARSIDKEIRIKNIKPNIKKLFFLTKLDEVFNIEEN